MLALVGTLLCVLSPAAAHAERDDDDDHGGVRHDCGGPGCHAYLDLRIDAFVPYGADAPASLTVYAGRVPLSPSGGAYHIPLTDAQGRWIVDEVDLTPLRKAGFAPGSYVVIRLGEGRLVHGLYGYLRRGKVYVGATATTVGPRVLSVRNYRDARFERQGDRVFVAGNPGQDEFVASGQVTTVNATVSSDADLLLTRVTCKGANLCVDVTCAAADQCHDAGICDPSTGRCSNPAKVDGSACDDGNACTQSDTCQSGRCVGANPKTCMAEDQCHSAGTCDPSTGQCSSPQLPDETPCDDGQFCTKSAWCVGGACTRQISITCDASAECQEEGVCDDLLRQCVYATKADGAACNDGNACTLGDYCVGGLCLGHGATVSCPGATQCLSASACSPVDGSCSAQEPAVDGVPCEDGLACTVGDSCQKGQCVGAPVSCGGPGACTAAGVCLESIGGCYYAPATPDPATVCASAGATCGDIPNGCGGTASCGSCAASETCASGHCIPRCASGLTYCAGACVDLGNDGANCGACGRACGALERCGAGQCAAACGPGELANTIDVVSSIAVGASPAALAINPTTRKVYAAYQASVGRAIAVLDPASDAVVASIDVGQGGEAIGVDPSTNRIYATDGSTSSLAVIDGAPSSATENTVIARASAAGRLMQSVRGLGIDPTTHRIYVPSFDPGGQIVVVSGETNTVVAQLGVAANPIVTAYNPTTNLVYVGHGSFFGRQALSLVAPSGAVSDGAVVGLQMSAIGVDPGTNRLYVHRGDPSRGSPWAVVVVDAATNAVLATVPVGGGEGAVGVDPARHLVYVANGQSDTVSVIDGRPGSPTANTVLKTVPVGKGPSGVAVDAVSGKVYVANSGGNTVSVLKAASAFCLIQGTCVAAGATEPTNACKACNPAADPLAYSAVPDGTQCPDDGNPCTADVCAAGICGHVAGNAGTICRPAAGPCDLAERCDGQSVDCPADAFEASTVVCRAAAGVCDDAELCTGASADCPVDLKSFGVCRAAAGACDVAESCDGVNSDCPPDALQPASVVCRAAAGACDVAESCTGASASCPADAKSRALCRPAAGICDTAEYCDGVANDCPMDGFQPSSVVCRVSANVCDPAEMCTGSSPSCPADVTNNGSPACSPCTGYACLRDVPSMILFGGNVPGSGLKSDVWALLLPAGGTPSWMQVFPAGTGPTPRSGSRAVYDSTRDRVLIYGGYDAAGPPLSEVWALSLGGTPAWSKLTTSGSAPAKISAGVIYQSALDRLVVTMGHLGDSCSNTTDTLDLGSGPTWAMLAPTGALPGGRISSAGFAFDEVGQRLFMNGGKQAWPATCGGCPTGNCVSLNDTFVLSFSGATANWTKLVPTSPPSPEADAAMIWDPVGSRAVRFGGWGEDGSGMFVDTTWVMSDPARGAPAWTQYTGAPRPPARAGAIGIYDVGNRRMLIHGGLTDNSGTSAPPDLWALDLSSASGVGGWSKPSVFGTPPASRLSAAATYVPARPCGGACATGLQCRGGQCVSADLWSPTATTLAPSPRWSVSGQPFGLWTGSRFFVWGGAADIAQSVASGTGGVYDPAANTWSVVGTAGAPSAREDHSTLWSGTRAIVWGGSPASGPRTNTGGRYDPATDSWTATSLVGAPIPRSAHSAVWTGSEMIVWGGILDGGGRTNTGGRYNPGTDTWVPIQTAGAPTARGLHVAQWTGAQMLIWGGGGTNNVAQSSGGRYDLATDSWSPISTVGAPPGLLNSRSVWTGSQLVVFGGTDGPSSSAGGVYNPVTDTWSAMSTVGAPSARNGHAMVWTGKHVLVWGGTSTVYLGDGHLYDPVTNSWSAMSASGEPAGRDGMAYAWSGNELLIWGGRTASGLTDSGGRYSPP